MIDICSLCHEQPISPTIVRHRWFAPMVAVNGESFARPEDAPFDLDKSSVVDVVDGIEDIDADTGDVTVCARALPTPKLPPPSVVAHHNLTHFPYRSWCPYCVAGRRPNTQHRSQSVDRGRSLPVFHADYCFPRDSHDESCITVLVGRMSPSKAMFASFCDVKGPTDAYALDRLENFLKDEGVSKISYRSDQEPAIVSLIETALKNSGKAGEMTDASPEHSAVGESASNGVAERTVQQFEDLLRTLKAALEARLKTRLPSKHPVMRWLIQHVASIYNRQSTNYDGQTPHEARHGRRSNGRTAEFGEKVLYFVPKRLRAKIDMRWRVGIFLGTAERTNEAFVGTVSGNVVKSRAITRVVHASKWDPNTLLKIVGTPAALCPNPNGKQDSAWIEGEEDPHRHEFDGETDAMAEGTKPPSEEAKPSKAAAGSQDVDSADPDLRNLPRIRIMRQDLIKYGYNDGCPRCRDLRGGRIHTQANHSEECRARIYSQWEANGDVKWKKAIQELGINSTDTGLAPPAMDVELEGLEQVGSDSQSPRNPETYYHCALRSSSEP